MLDKDKTKVLERKSFEEKNILSGKFSKFLSEMTCTPSTYRKLQRKFGQQKGLGPSAETKVPKM